MAFLADLERLLERLFERSSARLFRTHVQAVQLERRVERAMEHGRLTQAGRAVVPSRYRVRLAPPDLAAAAAQEGSAEALAGRLADAALAFARGHGYHLRGRPTVALVADPSIAAGEVQVDAILDGGTPVAPVRDPAPGAVPSAAPAAAPAEPVARGAGAPAMHRAAPTAGAAAAMLPGAASAPPATFGPVGPGAMAGAQAVPAPAFEEVAGGIRGDGTQTLVFRRPAPQTARARLRAFMPDGSERTIEVDASQLTVGRARDNGLVLDDGRVSRHHGRLVARHGALVYTDLGSTNGTRVNGVRVDEIVLGAGDRLLLGDTVLVVETLPA